jgi:hypothetical protein
MRKLGLLYIAIPYYIIGFVSLLGGQKSKTYPIATGSTPMIELSYLTTI